MKTKLFRAYAPFMMLLLTLAAGKTYSQKKKIRPIKPVGTVEPVLTTNDSLKGLYVNRFSSILGDVVKEDSLLMYAKGNKFNYLALYTLHKIDFTSTTKKEQLAAFIKKARTYYGVVKVGAIGETFSIFRDRIGPYNNNRADAKERFDIFNLEFEFWIPSSVQPGGVYATAYLEPQGYSLDTAGGFDFYQKQLHLIDSLATTQGALTETYVGWLNQGQAQFIAKKTDRILVHAYRTEPNSTFTYTKTRLSHFASAGKVVRIAPIFSAEPEFMGPWLAAGNTERSAFDIYKTNFNADASTWKQYIKIDGYQWFMHSLMPKTNLSPKLASFDEAEEISLAASPGLKIYPNPAKGKLNLDVTNIEASNLNIRIINVSGQLVHEQQLRSEDVSDKAMIDLTNLAKGFYLLQLNNEDNSVSVTEKFIIE